MTEWGIDTLFNPGKRHVDEEKRRLQSTREEVGDSSGGKRIDLDGGKVVISRKKPAAAASQSDDAAENSEAAEQSGAAESSDAAQTSEAADATDDPEPDA